MILKSYVMSKYIDVEKLIAEIERRIANGQDGYGGNLKALLLFITSLQQEQPEGINGVVHHTMCVHWIVPDQKQLNTALKEFPEGSEVELFIFARKEVQP